MSLPPCAQDSVPGEVACLLPGRELHPLEAPGFAWRTAVAGYVAFNDPLDIIGDSVYWLYANLCNPTSQIARVSGRDRTDARRVCACAAGLCCGLCRPLSTRQDLGRQGAPTPERRRRQRRLITD